MALQQTKDLHKRLEELRPNAVFSSSVQRKFIKEDKSFDKPKSIITSSVISTKH
jgi:hypothetical protein